MQPFIETPIQVYRARNGKINYDISAGQETNRGSLLGHMYYSSNLVSVLPEDNFIGEKSEGCLNRHGYPHNGGYHTFCLTGPDKSIGDMIAFTELLIEHAQLFNGRYDTAIADLNQAVAKLKEL